MVHVEAEVNRLGIPGPGPQSIGPPYDARGQNLCLAPVQSRGDSSGWFSNNWTQIAFDMFFLLQTKNDKLHRIRISRCDCPTMEPFFLFFRGIPKFDILSVLSKTEFHIQFMEILRGFKTWHHHVWTHRKMSKFFGEIDHFKTPMDLHIDASITSIAFGMFTRGYIPLNHYKSH